jgi:peptidoglycan/LPS O-acetylase OafA/YrhL
VILASWLWKAGLLLLAVAFVVTKGLVVGSHATLQLGYPLIGLSLAATVLGLSQLRSDREPIRTQQGQRSEQTGSRLLTVLSRFGAVAYAAYLVKLPAIDLVKDLAIRRGYTVNVTSLSGLGLMVVLLCGWVWFSVVERPLSRLTSVRSASSS